MLDSLQPLLDNTLLQRYVIEGGPVMYVLVPLSLLMLGAVLQSAIRLRSARVMPRRLMKKAGALTPAERIGFIKSLASDPSPLGQIVWLTLKDRLHNSDAPDWDELSPVLSNVTADVTDEMYDSVNLLETIYTVGPLLGLLGTILGMKQTFFRFSLSGADQTVSHLSVGIQQALVTTLWGIAVAIPSYTAAHVFHGWIRRHERDNLPKAAADLIDQIYASSAEPEASAEPAVEAAR
ncbi:MotA/TolQ/ExbB proton channel family protein [bacterium]|nr:MotA/TolQ/ExbB proton channel family protein [bacterium]